jgi:hypothetical protein
MPSTSRAASSSTCPFPPGWDCSTTLALSHRLHRDPSTRVGDRHKGHADRRVGETLPLRAGLAHQEAVGRRGSYRRHRVGLRASLARGPGCSTGVIWRCVDLQGGPRRANHGRAPRHGPGAVPQRPAHGVHRTRRRRRTACSSSPRRKLERLGAGNLARQVATGDWQLAALLVGERCLSASA